MIRVLELRCVKGSGGGPEKTIFLTAQYLTPKIFHTDIIYIGSKQDSEFNLMKAVHADMPHLNYREITEAHPFDWSLVTRLAEYCHKHDIHILHSHEYKTDVLCYFIRQRCPNIQWVSTLHSENKQNLKLRIYQGLAFFALRYCDAVFPVSQDLANVLAHHGISPAKIHVLLNGVDVEVFKPQPNEPNLRQALKIPSSSLIIGTVGRLSQIKNLWLMISAFQELLKSKPDAHLILSGEGPEKNKLMNYARQLKVENRVHFLGFESDVRKVYRTLDIFALSSDSEGMPNSILEAMAMQLPIVATDVSGTRLLIKNREDGMLCQTGDEMSFAEALNFMANHPEERKKMAEKARIKVIEHFQFKHRVERLAQFYEKLMEGKSK